MYFETLSEFLKMGKNGAFVWSAYAIVLISIIVIQVIARLQYRKSKRKLQEIKTWHKK